MKPIHAEFLNEVKSATGRTDWVPEIVRIRLDTTMSDGSIIRISANPSLSIVTGAEAISINCVLPVVTDENISSENIIISELVAWRHLGIIFGSHDMATLVEDVHTIDRLKTMPLIEVVADTLDSRIKNENLIGVSSTGIMKDPFSFAAMSAKDLYAMTHSMCTVNLIRKLAKLTIG